jgi:hypothetical protein
MGSYVHYSEYFGAIKDGGFCDHLNDSQRFKKGLVSIVSTELMSRVRVLRLVTRYSLVPAFVDIPKDLRPVWLVRENFGIEFLSQKFQEEWVFCT